MQPQQATLIHEFGDFELDTRRRLLLNRVDGTPVDITGRVLDALIYFVERPGQLVDKKSLMEALWPTVVVEDGNLSQTIHTLRRVLGEKAGEHRYIATVPGRGYKFVADVKTRDAQVVPPPAPTSLAPPSRRRQRILAVAALALVVLAIILVLARRQSPEPAPARVAVAHPSIAVLPFVDMSAEQDQAHFAEGLSEEILNLLAHADNLRVIARTSSFSFKDENVDIRTIAQRLGVTHVLEGSVRKSGQRLRITAQLIDTSTSAHVWSDTYDRDVHDVFGVQREIASDVASALSVTLARIEPRRAETTSTEAYEHYLEGRLLFNRRSGSDLLQAKSHFEQAVQADPGYGQAWAGLAGVYFVARFDSIELPNAMEKWREATERAVALAPEFAEGQVRAAQYFWTIGKRDVAEMHFARAVALDPNDPMVLGGSLSDAILDGRLDDAIGVARRMVVIDPLSANNRCNLGNLLMAAGHLPEAQVELERALELSPAGASTLSALADVLILQKHTDEALQVISRLPEGYMRDERLAQVYFARGNTGEGEGVLAKMQALAAKPDADTAVAVAIAEVHAMRRDPDRAFEWLDKARPRSRRQLEVSPAWELRENVQSSPYLGSLHADPRWLQLLETLKD